MSVRHNQFRALHRSTDAMKRLIRPLKHRQSAGFTLPEIIVSVLAGSLLIAGGAMAMRSVNSAMKASGQMASLRSSSITGLRLLRSEAQRSLHLMVKGGSTESDQAFTELDNTLYSGAIDNCGQLSEDSQNVFNPIFGLRMAELNEPVIYGLGMAKNGINYALLRCGPALSGDGRYEVENVVLSAVLENIGITPCMDGTCISGADRRTLVQNLNNELNADNMTQARKYPEPAFGIETDRPRKLLKLVAPNELSDASFLQPPEARRNLRVNLNFVAYARADKVNRDNESFATNPSDNSAYGNQDETDGSGCDSDNSCTFFGIPVTTKAVQLIVDGSGSMSTCISWGSNYGEQTRIYYNGSRYIRTKQNCLMTRMESLQKELRGLLESLSSDTTISLQSFSSPGYYNHRSWKNGQMVELNDSNRNSALEFVNSLSAGSVTRWGGTRPWNALDKAFENEEANSIFLMTDGEPNYDRNNGTWSEKDYRKTADAYIAMNNTRDKRGWDLLDVNTVSVGRQSTWMEMMSAGAGGEYKALE